MKNKFKYDFKEFINKKENLVLIAMVMILCAGIAVNHIKSNQIPLHDGDVLVDSQNIAVDENPKDEYTSLQQQRADLELKRNDLIAGYDDTIKNSTNKDEQKNAMEKKDKINQYIEQETAIEAIIKTKNLPDSLVIITDSTISVTIDEQDLKQNMVAKVCSIVMAETGRTADKIIIQSAY